MSINVNGSVGISQNTTEVTKIPVGTTAQRPDTPEAGMIRFNTDEGIVEWYDDVFGGWVPTSEPPPLSATGGTVTDITQDGIDYRVHTFTSSGTFEVTRGGEVEYLVVAGGGGGGSNRGGGGGAGGMLTSSTSLSVGNYPIIVGDGGEDYENGYDSSALSLTATGGGRGGKHTGSFSSNNPEESGADGGSGGGAAMNYAPVSFTGGSGTAGQGNDGGDSGPAINDPRNTGGGGGAGAAGISGSGTTVKPDGGDGLEWPVGSGNYYAGGGGGARGGIDLSSAGAGDGGLGGGGDGGEEADSSKTATTGQPNTGGGGGGSESDGLAGGSGGSGIVIVRYRIG